MPIISLQYGFRQNLSAPAREAFRWCTDFGPADGKLFSQPTQRSVRWLNEEALVMADVTRSAGRPLRIHRLVRIFPTELAWTNTHLDGPYRHSQYWYRIVPDGPRKSHLEFLGLRLERSPRRLSPAAIARKAEECRREDSGDWRTRLAPALARDLAPH
jgi:hypothetical protein